MCRGTRASFCRPGALPAIGLATIWFIVTMPLAIAATVAIGNLLGVE